MSQEPPGSIEAPSSIEDLARHRAAARARRDWHEADSLRGQIEAAGWKVIDDGLDFHLEPAALPDVVEGERVRYGGSASVPSRLAEVPSAPATIVLIAHDGVADAVAEVRAVATAAPEGTTLVVVSDSYAEGSDEPDDAEDPSVEVLNLLPQASPVAVVAAGIRRATGAVVVIVDGVVPEPAWLGPLIGALEDPAVAVAGTAGLDSGDLRRWEPAGPGEVDAVAWGAIAVRRADLGREGLLDERFMGRSWLGPWWSLLLRDSDLDAPPRTAVAVGEPPAEDPRGDEPDAAARRAAKRDFYRFIDAFGHRYDLLRSRRHPAGLRTPADA